MKMKEVCALTGLTERTIRFYTEKKLVTPKTSEQNGRTYAEYAAADVDTLRTVAVLRRMLFSLEEIERMQSKPKEISRVLDEYYERIAEEAGVRAEILNMDRAVLEKSKNITELARHMRQPAQNRRLPEGDVNPNFGRLDEEPVPDPEQAMREFKARQTRREQIGFAIILIIALVNVILSFISLFSGGSIITLVFDLIVSIALLAGRPWARVVFVIAAVIHTLVYFYLVYMVLMNMATIVVDSIAALLISALLSLVYSVACIILLTKNKCVHEYMYRE